MKKFGKEIELKLDDIKNIFVSVTSKPILIVTWIITVILGLAVIAFLPLGIYFLEHDKRLTGNLILGIGESIVPLIFTSFIALSYKWTKGLGKLIKHLENGLEPVTKEDQAKIIETLKSHKKNQYIKKEWLAQ